MKENNIKELSYYGLLLHAFLKESHPEKAYDYKLIRTRSDIASEIYSNAIRDGFPHNRAEELATKSLYLGLLFSKFDIIRNVLWEEFPYIPEKEVKEKALLLLPVCEEVFADYTLHDEFINSPEYNQLYTELIGQIDIWEEEDEL